MMKKKTFSRFRSVLTAVFITAVLVWGLFGINGFNVANAATSLLLQANASPPACASVGDKGTIYVDTGGKLQICDGSSYQQAVTSGGASSQVGAANVVQGTFGSGYAGSNNQYIFKPATNTTAALQVQNAAGTVTVFDVDTSNAMVGIGTASPGYKLDVLGSLRIDGSVSDWIWDAVGGLTPGYLSGGLNVNSQSLTNTGFISFVTNPATAGTVRLPNTGDIEWRNAANGANVVGVAFGTDNNLQLMPGGGNVGIGDTTPASLFTVGNTDLFQINSSGVVVAGTWQGSAIADSYVANDITASNYLPLSGGALTGAVTSNNSIQATNFYDGTGTYNVNLGSGGTEGRGLVAGYSGGSYGGIGYNIRHTVTGATYVAPSTDTVSYILFTGGGFSFQGAPAGTAGRTPSLSNLVTISAAGVLNTIGAITRNGNTVWDAANDGAGSLLDADFLDGNSSAAFYLATNPSGYITNDTSVAKNEIANSGTLGFTWSDAEVSDTLTASAFTGSVTDAQVPDSITITTAANANAVPWSGISSKPTTVSGFGITDFVSSNSGSATLKDNATTNGTYYTSDVSLFGQTDGALFVQAFSTSWVGQIYQDYRTGQLAIRGKNNGTWQAWRTVWDSSNLTNNSQLTNGSGYITNDTSVPKGDLANSGTLGFTWSDTEVADNITASNYVPLGGGSMTGALTVTVAGTDITADKIDASTIDPVYTIGGKRYATYVSGMTGIREETTGVIKLLEAGEYVIDFNNLEKGSDLWLFAQAINVDGRSYVAESGKIYRTTAEELFNNTTVLLTPGFDGNVWYKKDVKNKKITIFANKSGEVSYRLTAPRFDSKSWSNYSDAEHEGLNLDKLLK